MGSMNIIGNLVLWPLHILSLITFSLTGLCGTTLYFVICLRMPDRSHAQPATVRCTPQAFAPLPTKLGIREMGTWISMDVGENFMKVEKFVTISMASEALTYLDARTPTSASVAEETTLNTIAAQKTPSSPTQMGLSKRCNYQL